MLMEYVLSYDEVMLPQILLLIEKERYDVLVCDSILGILNLAPSTGYDIKKYCDHVLSGFWNENFGHIYPTLKTLQGEGLIEVMTEEKSDKKIRYRITLEGKKELEKWLLEDTVLQPTRSEFMLKLIFSSALPREQVIQNLDQYKKVHEEKIAQYQVMLRDLEQGIPEFTKERVCFNKIMLRRGLFSDEAVVQWCEESIEALQRL